MKNHVPVTLADLVGPLPRRYAFERLVDRDLSFEMGWTGTFELALAKAEPTQANLRDRRLLWRPARVVRGVVDSPLSGEERIELVCDVTAFAAGVYAGISTTARHKKLVEDVKRHGLHRRNVSQMLEDDKAVATNPRLSHANALRLAEKSNKPVAFVPICHSGFIPAVHALLYSRRHDSAIYPIRHSRHGHGDMNPNISKEEKRLIYNMADGRIVVVYDEIADSGTSIVDVIGCLRMFLPSNCEIYGMVNQDLRTKTDKREQGISWEGASDKPVRKIARFR